MKKEELIDQLNNAFYDSAIYMKEQGLLDKFIKKRKQALKEIVALIKKEVSEEFVEK